ncbi:MAG TPA: ribonuclease HII [Lachnospiraceae bacterium]|nr:ribonuclease HII [Lachnospiraceae bacterium]
MEGLKEGQPFENGCTAFGKKSIACIGDELKALKEEELTGFIEKYEGDTREGVRKLVKRAGALYDKYQKELERIERMSEYERRYGELEFICGIDEAGRGPLAGPVYAAAVILDKNRRILYVNDSKALSPAKREELYDEIMEKAVSVGVGFCDSKRIDEINILQATYEAMRMAIQNLTKKPDILLNDAVRIPLVDIRQVPIIKGDAKSVSIAAASIIAKVSRDRVMEEYAGLYPEYDFSGNKGYGTARHIEALRKYGPCPIHRRSFIGGIEGIS